MQALAFNTQLPTFPFSDQSIDDPNPVNLNVKTTSLSNLLKKPENAENEKASDKYIFDLELAVYTQISEMSQDAMSKARELGQRRLVYLTAQVTRVTSDNENYSANKDNIKSNPAEEERYKKIKSDAMASAEKVEAHFKPTVEVLELKVQRIERAILVKRFEEALIGQILQGYAGFDVRYDRFGATHRLNELEGLANTRAGKINTKTLGAGAAVTVEAIDLLSKLQSVDQWAVCVKESLLVYTAALTQVPFQQMKQASHLVHTSHYDNLRKLYEVLKPEALPKSATESQQKEFNEVRASIEHRLSEIEKLLKSNTPSEPHLGDLDLASLYKASTLDINGKAETILYFNPLSTDLTTIQSYLNKVVSAKEAIKIENLTESLIKDPTKRTELNKKLQDLWNSLCLQRSAIEKTQQERLVKIKKQIDEWNTRKGELLNFVKNIKENHDTLTREINLRDNWFATEQKGSFLSSWWSSSSGTQSDNKPAESKGTEGKGKEKEDSLSRVGSTSKLADKMAESTLET